ncbi:MAG TPA: hypothetical protein VH044_07590 [Polyangiaceae bacterium]|nr:hypothetical protein [Polyangiaceae bacterium]
MTRSLLAALPLIWACSSGSDASPPPASSPACPDAAGTWTITAHCDASFVGQSVMVTQNDCSLSLAAPFDGFAGTLASDGKLTLSGPQSCTGTVTATSIAMSCTPGTCVVTLAR